MLTDFCRRWHIRKLSVFGSAIRPDFGPDSDLDILVEFETGQTPGLAFFALQRELSELLGHPVDLNTPACLPPAFRAQVQAEAEVRYVAA
jgi:predicted nucleotidyltransferase